MTLRVMVVCVERLGENQSMFTQSSLQFLRQLLVLPRDCEPRS